MMKGFLARIGGILAIVSLTVLPLAGCGSSTLSGIDILTVESLEISIGIKILLVVAMFCAIGALIVKSQASFLASGLVGLGSLLASYLILRQEFSNIIEMKMGGYLSVIGFIFILGEGLLPRNSQITDEGDTS